MVGTTDGQEYNLRIPPCNTAAPINLMERPFFVHFIDHSINKSYSNLKSTGVGAELEYNSFDMPPDS